MELNHASSTPEPKMTMEERQAKLEALRSKIRLTAQANHTDRIEEHNRHRVSAREQARLERERKLAETLREKADAEEAGEDLERKRNWEYSIEENDEWEKRLKRKAGRADFQFHDANDAARKKYKKDLDLLKPDLAAYNRQKEAALGLVPGALSKLSKEEQTKTLIKAASSTSSTSITPISATLAAEDLYRDANTLQYGDNKPSEEAIDRVVAKLNLDLDKRGKFSRKRLNDDEGDITYINEHNKVFNKKIARYYDKYTKEIRDSFERGTAL
ncbi:SYF2 splicing factor-domain-containing protein [Cantharellus anzutake]|uniref:SYF2 splicing factor-domain-containing protein n=1 Tax=Cantharellus anzutake TaxID=1750568 RepID=UPI00190436B4|nr:SYF2 splicing factor-domain-containing protein [Cantharellus anzutake]KAF8328687.1 SYF2 splicing factor-domain-containing protein [Cantharellus anzutake]